MIAGGVTGYALNGGFSGAQQQTQGEGPWSSADYVNGADLQSDQFHNARQASIFDGLPSATEADYLRGYGPRGGDYYASQCGGSAQQAQFKVEIAGTGWKRDFTLPDGTPVMRSTINPADPTRLIGDVPLDAAAPMVPGYAVDRIHALQAWNSKDVYYSPIPFDPQMVAAQEGFRVLSTCPHASQHLAPSAHARGHSRAGSHARGQVLHLAPKVFLPLSSGTMNPIGRFGGSGGVISSRSASKTCLN